MVGMIPMLAVAVLDEGTLKQSVAFGRRFAGFFQPGGQSDGDMLRHLSVLRGNPGHRQVLLSAVGMDRLKRLLARMFDEGEFLSPHGLRALSAYHRDHPHALDIGGFHATISYEPAESTTPTFGGNSNWRGPLWIPLNYLVLDTMQRYHRFFGQELTFEYPTGSGLQLPVAAIAADLEDRLISIFLTGSDGRRPCFGWAGRLQSDPAWKDNLVFSEYFNGDNAAGLGAAHQTGWTALIADLIRRRHGQVPTTADVIHRSLGMQALR